MKIAVLGDGVEGKSVRRYFESQGTQVAVFDEAGGGTAFEDLELGGFDLVFRSPSVVPNRVKSERVTSVTRYFFEKCPAKIVGVTATKGKGTMSSMIKSILEINRKVWLVGNIGEPALDILDEVGADDVVIYELSSFQLWDMTQSPWKAVVGLVEPDHLNVHMDMDDYAGAKRNIVKFQGEGDETIYYMLNELSRELGESSPAERKLGYPSEAGAHVRDEWFWFGEERLCEVGVLQVPGEHNVENALGAITVCWDMVSHEDICAGLKSFRGLPHRLELVRELDGVRYYDDNFSTVPGATEVAVRAFAEPVVLIAGGSDKGGDYAGLAEFLNGRENVKEVLLMGETAEKMSQGLNKDFEMVGDLAGAMARAVKIAERGDVVLMSPGAASFDQFENVKTRAAEFQRLVKGLVG